MTFDDIDTISIENACWHINNAISVIDEHQSGKKHDPVLDDCRVKLKQAVDTLNRLINREG